MLQFLQDFVAGQEVPSLNWLSNQIEDRDFFISILREEINRLLEMGGNESFIQEALRRLESF